MFALSPSFPIQTADRNGMDKEDIEARAQEFVAFFERCKGLSRSSATTSIASCLQDLQIFLESIDHWRRHNPPVGSQRSEEAPEALPSLGPLLLQLGRNPVVLASASLSDPLAKTLLWYSGQSDNADDQDRPRIEDTWMEERRWCASRIQDMCRRQGQLSKSLGHGYQRQPEAKKAAFEELFGVQEQELEDQVLDQTLDSLSEALQGLASMMSIKPLTTSVLTFMIKWNSQLSALCAPMIPISRAHGLILGTIKTAHQLWTKAQTCSLSVTKDLLLDATFVEQIVAHQDKGSLTEILCGNYFTEFFTIAPLARRRNLMLIMDEILVACQEQPDFYSSPKTIIQQHFEKSRFLAISSTKFRKNRDFVHLLLQDAAALSGEIDDWRLVRIWTLLVGWIVGQAGPKETEVDRFQGEDEAAFMALDASEKFLKLLIARMASLEHQWNFFSTETLAERDVRGILWAQRNYIYRSAHPEQLLLRKRLAFLIGAATNNLIVHMVCNCFHSAAGLSRQTTEASTSSTPVQSATALLLAGTSVVMESDLQLDALSGQFAACLRALQELCFVCKRDPQAKRGLQVPLESILDQYAPVLNLNQPLMADIICGMGIYIGQDNRCLWNSLIQAVLSRASPGLQGTNTIVLSAPILARLRDIAEVMGILDLDFTLNTLLATD